MRNLYERVAKKKYQLGDDWRVYKWEAIGSCQAGEASDVLVTGAVAPFFKRGKYKGCRNWRKLDKSTLLQGAITTREIDEFLTAFEATTGLCHECEGSAQEWTGWYAGEGNRFRPCRRCNATGKAPSNIAA